MNERASRIEHARTLSLAHKGRDVIVRVPWRYSFRHPDTGADVAREGTALYVYRNGELQAYTLEGKWTAIH